MKISHLISHDTNRTIYKLFKRDVFEYLNSKRDMVTQDGYSFLPFLQHKCIFVHIPKAAGVSICKSLFGNLAGGHTTISEYRIAFSEDEFNEFFKFTFVRNPWDRTFSAFNFLYRGGMNSEDKEWAKNNLSMYKDFEEFVTKGLGKRNILERTHFLPQTHFICESGNPSPLVDFVGFVENIEDDFRFIQEKLDIKTESALIHINKTSVDDRVSYTDCYTEEMRQIVAEIYKDDIACFGYSFDNSSLESIIRNRNKNICVGAYPTPP